MALPNFTTFALRIATPALLLVASACAQDLSALRGTHASAVLLDAATGREIAQWGDVGSAQLAGSTLKPFLLDYALEHHVVSPHDSVHCDGNLRVGGHNLACVHPRNIVVLDARQALAQSCNVYFAMVARRLGPHVADALREFGLPATAATTADGNVLLALGLSGGGVSARRLAAAYAKLARQMNANDAASVEVGEALRDSVLGGMAHAAFTPGVDVAGKTGTTPRDGWFAGIVMSHDGRATRVLVVRVPYGNGRDAAELARRTMAVSR